ncbi:AraC family transcriptional regulator [Minwuia thermotolerans]|uniref:AraC family transcriptional regulator n=1 Tax=Minwuia thermotolerans TaxID=2056226 RepID=A0A2M9G3K3_9PROT|nr:AraC family transcriptional regulator [Minwuia thermotolerans]PJK30295.1 AraC family transcriptional regulator [Minwuia thermotolerans]
MSEAHDQASSSLAPASISPPGADPLSDVLRSIRLTGALFFVVDASSPWCVDIPRAKSFAEIILPGARQIISYHVVVEGRGHAGVPGSPAVEIGPGDIVVFPHGDPYTMLSEPGTPPELGPAETMDFFRDLAAGRLPFVIPEGGGAPPPAKFICGFLGCDLSPFNPLLANLPRLLHIRRSAAGEADLLDRLIELTLEESRRERAGGASIRLGLSELMFVEALRRHLSATDGGGCGWLSGLADPGVGRALSLIHADPARGWTLAALAQEAGLSRSVLAARFAATVGETPMHYLALWRMHVAGRYLRDGVKVAAVAREVGYASEAAFSRAFKKFIGLSPAAWHAAER